MSAQDVKQRPHVYDGESGLQAFATEVNRRNLPDVKRDFTVVTDVAEEFKFVPCIGGGSFELGGKVNQEFPLNRLCHTQLANRLGIPQKYYDRMMDESPVLLGKNVNGWLQHQPKKMMIRTLDGNARAYLSRRYRPIDNYDLMDAVLPILQEQKLDIKQSAITDSHLYLKAVWPEVNDVIIEPGNHTYLKEPEIVQSGFVISNSEVGCGAVKIEMMIWTLTCRNGLIVCEAIRQMHVGGGNGDAEGIEEYFRDDTRAAIDNAFFRKVRDVIRATGDRDQFSKTTAKLKRAVEDPLPVEHISEITGEIGNRLDLTETEQKGMLAHLAEGGLFNRYGAHAALTRTAQDVSEYDRQIELERKASRIIELPPSDWRALIEKAGKLSDN